MGSLAPFAGAAFPSTPLEARSSFPSWGGECAETPGKAMHLSLIAWPGQRAGLLWDGTSPGTGERPQAWLCQTALGWAPKTDPVTPFHSRGLQPPVSPPPGQAGCRQPWGWSSIPTLAVVHSFTSWPFCLPPRRRPYFRPLLSSSICGWTVETQRWNQRGPWPPGAQSPVEERSHSFTHSRLPLFCVKAVYVVRSRGSILGC